MARDSSSVTDRVAARMTARGKDDEALKVAGHFIVRARNKDGDILWEEHGPNLIVNAGLTYLNGVALTGVTQITAWSVGLMQAASSPSSTLPTVAAGDTMSSHAGWAEVTAYSQANRVAWTGVAGAAGASTNAASVASFTINADNTYVGGVFLTSNNTKGGTTGTMFSGRAFAAVRTLNNTDSLEITYATAFSAS